VGTDVLGDHCDRMMGVKLRCSECSDKESKVMSVTYDFLWFCGYFEEGAVKSGRGGLLAAVKIVQLSFILVE
jgi:hypothetical protein